MEIIRVCACAVPKITMRQTVRSFSCSWISSKGAYLAGLLDHTFCCFARLTHPLHKYACLPLDERCVPLAIRQQKILNGRQKVGRISGRPDMVSIRESGRGCVFLQNGDCRKISHSRVAMACFMLPPMSSPRTAHARGVFLEIRSSSRRSRATSTW